MIAISIGWVMMGSALMAAPDTSETIRADPIGSPVQPPIPAPMQDPVQPPAPVAPRLSDAPDGLTDPADSADEARREDEPDHPADPPTPPALPPSMPEIQELPSRPQTPSHRTRRPLFNLEAPGPERKPAGSDGGSFFDPGKLEQTGPSGGTIQIRGYVASNFFLTMRTNTLVRSDDGTFERLPIQPFFDVSSATLYVGAPVFADIVYARMGLEFLSIPQQQIVPSRPDVVAQPNRQLYFESAAIEVNPFTWAKNAGRWFREGFKITTGVFIVPFGLEDEVHANPANWFVGRPRSMSSGRVYPGTWTDVGAVVKWKPTFGQTRPLRPLEIDFGLINGDPCTQTRFIDALYQPDQGPLRCPRVRREGEVQGTVVFDDAEGPLPINAGFFGVAPDNNTNKSIVARVQGFIRPSINVGGSIVWGKHPEAILPTGGQTTVDLRQAGSMRVGGHIELNLEELVASLIPLPHLRAEVVYGIDRAIDRIETADRSMLGGYAQIAQALFRRKKTRLPGLIVQYRFDHADPSLATPGVVGGVPILSNFADTIHAGESTRQSHTIGLRFPVLPRFLLKADYTINREDGGRTNQLHDDLFSFEMVADF